MYFIESLKSNFRKRAFWTFYTLCLSSETLAKKRGTTKSYPKINSIQGNRFVLQSVSDKGRFLRKNYSEITFWDNYSIFDIDKVIKPSFRILSKIIFLIILFILSQNTHAELRTSFPKKAIVNQKTLNLNGFGRRSYTIFKYKVYDIALYLEENSNNSEDILSSNLPKKVVLKFLNTIQENRIRKEWSKMITRNFPNTQVLQPELNIFLNGIEKVKREDIYEFDFESSVMTVKKNGKVLGQNNNLAFQRALLAIWLGEKPDNSHLKTSLLKMGRK